MEGPHYNLVIYGGNPAGLACAVRAAREGLTVLLVNHTPHIGGLPANGMGLWDTLYEGWRSPIYNEMRQAIFDHYRNTQPACPAKRATPMANTKRVSSNNCRKK